MLEKGKRGKMVVVEVRKRRRVDVRKSITGSITDKRCTIDTTDTRRLLHGAEQKYYRLECYFA